MTADAASSLRIDTALLDDVCSKHCDVDLVKLDVDGHELEVLQGGRRILESGRVRGLIFEDHTRSFNSPFALLLGSFGYVIFVLTRSFRGHY